MKQRQGLFFNVGELLTGKASEKTFDINLSLRERNDPEIIVASPVKGTVRFVPTGNGVLGYFKIYTTLSLVCSIDGEEFEEPMRLDFTHEYQKDGDADNSPILPDNTVDVVPTIWDEIVVNIPMKPLCLRHKA